MPVIETNGVKLSYREVGKPNKHTIAFAHPVLFDSTVFAHLESELADDFHLILLDIHGHGESDYRSALTLEDMSRDYSQFLKALGVSKLTWVGYSIGGMIGMRLALRNPALIDSLILIATNARPDAPEIRRQTWDLWERFRDGHREDIVDAALRFLFADKTFQSQPQLVEKYREKIIKYDQAQGKAMFEVARAVFDRNDISQEIHAITAQTLVIAAADDPMSPPEESELIASRIQNARLTTAINAGHLLVVEKPRYVRKLVSAFLRNKRASKSGSGSRSTPAYSRLAADLAHFFRSDPESKGYVRKKI